MAHEFYILTRFNSISFSDRPHLMDNNLNDGWLEARLKMFKKYCYPSIVNQSWQEFTWVVFVHPESPVWFMQELSELDRITTSKEYWYKDSITKYSDINVTVRLDSDDLLHRDYMKVLHGHLDEFKDSGLKRQVHAFKHGYRYHENTGPRGTLWYASKKSAPFLALFADIRHNDLDSNVYCRNHGLLPDRFPTKLNTDLAAWMYVLHNDNISGSAQNAKKVADITKTFAQFGVNK